MFLSVISKPQQRGGLGPSCAAVPREKKYIYYIISCPQLINFGMCLVLKIVLLDITILISVHFTIDAPLFAYVIPMP